MADAFLESGAAQWGLDPDAFARASDAASPKGGPLQAHLADFGLAVACAEGHAPAWDHLIREFRPRLERAAVALDPTGGAVDLADELFADLYSQKLFRHFYGRSSLSTWLRAVLAQRFVDRLRAGRRTEPLEDDDRVPAVARSGGPDDSVCRAAVRQALTQAIDGLSARDRLVLGCYYSQGLKLAAIGRLLREHEATVSRHLTRIRQDLRTAIEASVAVTLGDDETRRDCLRMVMDDAGDLDLAALLPPSPRLRPATARSDDGIVHTERDRAAD
jgi:RNA polymerase sigma factor (sigma-70 family)